jgi:hypothetical protein
VVFGDINDAIDILAKVVRENKLHKSACRTPVYPRNDN